MLFNNEVSMKNCEYNELRGEVILSLPKESSHFRSQSIIHKEILDLYDLFLGDNSYNNNNSFGRDSVN